MSMTPSEHAVVAPGWLLIFCSFVTITPSVRPLPLELSASYHLNNFMFLNLIMSRYATMLLLNHALHFALSGIAYRLLLHATTMGFESVCWRNSHLMLLATSEIFLIHVVGISCVRTFEVLMRLKNGMWLEIKSKNALVLLSVYKRQSVKTLMCPTSESLHQVTFRLLVRGHPSHLEQCYIHGDCH
jgi:hypothetical protein